MRWQTGGLDDAHGLVAGGASSDSVEIVDTSADHASLDNHAARSANAQAAAPSLFNASWRREFSRAAALR